MKKQTKLISLIGLLVIAVGGFIYLSSDKSELEVDLEPPTLEEDISLQGSLTTGSRFFNVLNLKDKQSAGALISETDSNFLLFSLGEGFKTTPVSDFVENLLVSDGAEGFLFGKFEGKSWKLFPNKAYLSSTELSDTDLNACSSYFVVKLAHDAAISQPKSNFDYDRTYLNSITADSENCLASDRGLVANGWNILSGDFSSKDEFIKYVSEVADISEVYDTYIINQTDRQKTALADGRNEASMLVYSKEKGVDELDAYFQGQKRDMWLKLGSSNSSVPVIKTSSITIDSETVSNGAVVGKLIVDGSEKPFVYETVGSSNFEIANNGDVKVVNIEKLEVESEVEFKVSEQANANDFDQDFVTMKLDLDVDKCNEVNTKVSDNVVYLTRLVSSFDPNNPPEIVGLINESEAEFVNVCSKFNIVDDSTESLTEITNLKETLDDLIVNTPQPEQDSGVVVKELNRCLTESLYGQEYWVANNPLFPVGALRNTATGLISSQPFTKYTDKSGAEVMPEMVVEFSNAEFCLDNLKIETISGLMDFQVGQFYEVSTSSVDLTNLRGFKPTLWDSNRVHLYSNYLDGILVLTVTVEGSYNSLLGVGSIDLDFGKGLFTYEDLSGSNPEVVTLEGASYAK